MTPRRPLSCRLRLRKRRNDEPEFWTFAGYRLRLNADPAALARHFWPRALRCSSSPTGRFPLPVGLCFALIAASAWMNLWLAFRYPAAHRLTPLAAMGLLTFDTFQLAGLLYLTGGLTNPSRCCSSSVVISALPCHSG